MVLPWLRLPQTNGQASLCKTGTAGSCLSVFPQASPPFQRHPFRFDTKVQGFSKGEVPFAWIFFAANWRGPLATESVFHCSADPK